MAEPKKKLSRTRTHRRRAQYKITAPAFRACSNCGKPGLPHIVCQFCGYYDGKPVISQAPTKRIVLDGNDQSDTTEK